MRSDSPLPIPRPDRASGPLGRALARVSTGVRTTSDQVQPWGAYWDDHNEVTLGGLRAAPGPWWVTLGDSCAQGIGAGSPERGWAGQVMDAIDRPWFNLSVSGATTSDLLAVQLPALQGLIGLLGVPETIAVAIGANDLFRSPNIARFSRAFREIGEALPETRVLLALPPHAPISLLGIAADRTVRIVAADHGYEVVDINRYYRAPYRGLVAADRFHPNESGYQAWSRAFADALTPADDPLDRREPPEARITPR